MLYEGGPVPGNPQANFSPAMYAMDNGVPYGNDGFASGGPISMQAQQQPSGLYTVSAGGDTVNAGNGGGDMYFNPNADGFDYGGPNAFSTAMPVSGGDYGMGNRNGGGRGGRGNGGRGGGVGYFSTNGYGGGNGGESRGRFGGRGRGGGNGAMQNHMSDEYEVHDNQLKAPVAVNPSEVVPTVGSYRLFSAPPQPIVYGSRNVFRLCDAFLEGRCTAGDKCHDVHVLPEHLNATRRQMTAWLQSREDEFNATLQHDPTKTFRIFVADLKEVVDVPVTALTFTKGLYVDPATRARRTRAAHSHGSGGQNAFAAQVPTGCGLYASDPNQCKWGRWCNQVHIDPGWMREKKEDFARWFDSLEKEYDAYPPTHLFAVHDPQLKTSLQLPKYSISNFTRGLFQGSSKKAPSVCLLFQKGRCTAGACCNQIHIIAQYLNLLREQVMETGGGGGNGGADGMGQPPFPGRSAALDALSTTLLAQAQTQQLQQQQQQQQLQLQQAMPQCDMERPPSGGDFASAAPEPQETAHKIIVPSPAVELRPDNPISKLDSDNFGVALFEHIQVDDEAMDYNSHSHSHMERSGRSADPGDKTPDMFNNPMMSSSRSRHMGTRHINANGSYTNNPYGSVTSLPDAQGDGHNGASSLTGPTAFTRGPNGSTSAVARYGAPILASSKARPPAHNVATYHQLEQMPRTLSTDNAGTIGGKGMTAANDSTADVGMPTFLASSQRSGSNANLSTTNLPSANTSGTALPANYTSGTRHITLPQPPTHHQQHQQPPYPQRMTNAVSRTPMSAFSNRSQTGRDAVFTPPEFDASLHFSPSPLMSCNASYTSASRNPHAEDGSGNDSTANLALRVAASGTTYPHANDAARPLSLSQTHPTSGAHTGNNSSTNTRTSTSTTTVRVVPVSAVGGASLKSNSSVGANLQGRPGKTVTVGKRLSESAENTPSSETAMITKDSSAEDKPNRSEVSTNESAN